MSQSDQTIAEGLKRGDQDALRSLFNLYFHDLVVFAVKMVINEGVAEEIVEDVFIALWNSRFSFNLDRNFKNYLYQAVKNRSLNYLKSKYGRLKFEELDQIQAHYASSSADENLNLDELKQEIHAAITRLPLKCRIIFNLSRNAGLSIHEISDQLGISKKTVQAQISIAIRKIKAELGGNLRVPNKS